MLPLEFLNKLEGFNENSTLFDLIEAKEIEPSYRDQMVGLLSSFIGLNTKKKFGEREQKELIRALKSLDIFLDDKAWKLQYDAKKLDEIARPLLVIQNNGTIACIKDKLLDERIHNHKIEIPLERIVLLSNRILAELNRLKNKQDVKSTLARLSLLPPLMPIGMPMRVVNPGMIQPIANAQFSSEMRDRLQAGFSRLTISNDPESEKDLQERFERLTSSDEIKAAAQVLDLNQATCLKNYCLQNSRETWKLPYLIFSLSYKTLQEFLLAHNQDEIIPMNKALSGCDKSIKRWINFLFNHLRNDFIKTCNDKKEAIDTLADRFRKNTEGHTITRGDIDDIEIFFQDVCFHQRIIVNLVQLITDIVYDPETNHVLKEIQAEYELFSKRLSYEEKDWNENGNIYGILKRNVFERCHLSDEDEAYEILGGWNIFRLDDYIEAGLIKPANAEELDRWKKEPTEAYKLAQQNLKNKGVATIKDWSRKKIYNRKMLEDFLKKV